MPVRSINFADIPKRATSRSGRVEKSDEWSKVMAHLAGGVKPEQAYEVSLKGVDLGKNPAYAFARKLRKHIAEKKLRVDVLTYKAEKAVYVIGRKG